MTFTTYTEARAALDNINARYFAEMEAGRSLKIGVSSEAEFAAHADAKMIIGNEARANGFAPIAVGGWSLNKAQVKLNG